MANSNTIHSLPECIAGKQFTEAEQDVFWQAMTNGGIGANIDTDDGLSKGLLLQSQILRAADLYAQNHKTVSWQYVVLDQDQQLFFMYPKADYLYSPANELALVSADFGIDKFTPKAYGLYVTLLALQNHARLSDDSHWQVVNDKLQAHIDSAISVEISTKWPNERVQEAGCSGEAKRCFDTYGIMAELLY